MAKKGAKEIVERLGELKDKLPEGATVEGLIEKAEEREAMDRSKRKQIGVQIDPDLWMEYRRLALNLNRSASDLVEEAMRDYLQKVKKEGD